MTRTLQNLSQLKKLRKAFPSSTDHPLYFFSRFRKLQELDRDVHISSPHGFLFHSVLHTMYCDGFPELDLVLDGSILHRGTTLPRSHDNTYNCVPARVQ